jgi:FKBP-type peptidyl-prolyl cis-trans isomerase
MRLNLCLLLGLCLALALSACSESGTAAIQAGKAGAPETEDQKVLYVLGQLLGQNIENAGFTESDMAPVLLGLSDKALKRPSQVSLDEYGPKLDAFMNARMQTAVAAELTESQAFIEKQAQATGATRTASGIIIQNITAGTGATPAATDTVRVHYHGTLRDGTVFDSSVDRGEPVSFPLNQVIPCWTEGVQQIRLGGKARLTCPADLAYGPGGRPGIPGNAVLTFEVELLEINPK